jgi:hypothetical protein
MAMFLYALTFLIIPIFSFSLFKRLLIGYLTASFFCAVLVITRMIYLEANAPDREFDFIFGVSVLIWGMAPFVLYLPYLALAKFIKNHFSKNEI